MQCEKCGGLVTWRGPFSALTHTECERCGGINCQVVEHDPIDEAEEFEADCEADGLVAVPYNAVLIGGGTPSDAAKS